MSRVPLAVLADVHEQRPLAALEHRQVLGNRGRLHAPGFLALVEEVRRRVKTTTIPEYLAMLERGERPLLVDVREDREWDAGHLPGAVHLGKGIIERDIEAAVPDPATPVLLYCGGGYRTVLVCESLQRMGYTNCISLDGGWRAWNELALPVVKPAPEAGPR
jgi:rhodanese-related sulfurtransferase